MPDIQVSLLSGNEKPRICSKSVKMLSPPLDTQVAHPKTLKYFITGTMLFKWKGGPGKSFDSLPCKSANFTHFGRNIPKFLKVGCKRRGSWLPGSPLDPPLRRSVFIGEMWQNKLMWRSQNSVKCFWKWKHLVKHLYSYKTCLSSSHTIPPSPRPFSSRPLQYLPVSRCREACVLKKHTACFFCESI